MENDNKKKIAVGIAIIALILILGGFYYSYKTNKGNEETFNPDEESTRGIDSGAVEVVDIRHQYKDGVHTYAGEINLATPCDSVEVTAVKDTTNLSNVTLQFTSTSTEEVCAQVITARRFKVSFEGGEDVNVRGMLNGRELRLNVFEVPSGEDLESFEVDVKG